MTQRQVSLFQFATSDKSKRRRIAPEVEFSDSGDEDNDNDIFNGLVVYFDHKSMKKKRRKVLRHLVRKHGATTIVHINETVTHIFIETGPFNEKLKKYSRWTRYPTDCYLLRVEWIRDSLNVNHCLDTTAYELPIKKIALRYHSKDNNYVLDDYAELTDSGYTNLYKRIADFETTTENGFDSSGSSFDDGIYDNETSCDDDWLTMTPSIDCCSYHSLTELMLGVLKRKFEPKKPECITIESDEDSETDEESSEYEEDKQSGEDEVNKSCKDKEHGQHSRDKEDSQSDEEEDESESSEEDDSKSETNKRNVISDQEDDDDDENDTGKEDGMENIVKGNNKGGDIVKEDDEGSNADEEDKENDIDNQENSIDKKENNIKTKGQNNIEKDQAISNKKEDEEKNIIKDKEKSNSEKVEAIIIVKKDETKILEKKDFANSIEIDEKNIIKKRDQKDIEVNNGNSNTICIETGNGSYRDKSNNNLDNCTSENENSTVSYVSKNNIADKPFATSSPLVVRLSKIRVKTLTDIHIPDKCSIVVNLNNEDLTSSLHEPEATSTSAKQMGEFTNEKPIIGKISDPQINFLPPVQTKIMPVVQHSSSLKHLSPSMKLDESTVHQLEISKKFEINESVDENMEISCDASYKKENEISFFEEQNATNSKNQMESFAQEPNTSKYMTASKELMDTNHPIVTSEKVSDEGFSLKHLKPLLNEVVDIVCKHVEMEFENEPRNVNSDSNISSVIFDEKKINQSSLLTVINKDVLHIGSENFDELKTVNICAAVSTCKSSSIQSSRKTDSNNKFVSQNTESGVETAIMFQNIKCNEMQKVDSTVESHISDIKSNIDPKYVVTNLEDLDKNDCAVVNKSLDLSQIASELEENSEENFFKGILTEIIEKVTQTELHSVDNTFSQIKLCVDSTVKMNQNDEVNDNTFLTSENYISQGSKSECENFSTSLELKLDSNTFSNFTTNEDEIMLDPFPTQLFLSKEMLDPTSENVFFTADEFDLSEIVKSKTNIRKRHLSNEEVHCSNLDTKINHNSEEQTISDSKRPKISDPETLSVSDPGSSSFILPDPTPLLCPYYELSGSKNEILPVSEIDRNCKDVLNWMRRCPNQKLIIPFQKLLGSFKATKTKWRVATYEKAIVALADLDKQIESLDECFNIPGIGKRIAQKIWRIVEDGSLDEVKYICSKRWVETMKLFRKSWGITPKLAKKLYMDGICTVTDVRKYPYLPTSVQVGFHYYDDLRLKMSKEEAGCIMSAVLNEIFRLFPKVECHGCSSLRRNKPSCGHVCILVSLPKFTPNDHKVLPEIVAQLHERGYIADDLLRHVENGAQTKYVGVFKLSPLSKHRRLCITVCTREEFPCALMYLTGPAYFNKAIQQRAFKKEMVLDEHSLRIRVLNIGGNTHSNIKLHIEDEATIFKYLDLPYRTPEQRDVCLPN